ncbi:unnamed protein product [Acanthoscelides obtectus]|nr:unnamed protein product [Acanthoscelides obtectus]CAK1663133.1 hypothetical protein AOBTE_LOCUS23495 [Acanthoscelides obtectus]
MVGHRGEQVPPTNAKSRLMHKAQNIRKKRNRIKTLKVKNPQLRKNWRGLHRPFLFFCGGFRPDTVRIPGIFNFDKLLQPRIKDLQEENQWGR